MTKKIKVLFTRDFTGVETKNILRYAGQVRNVDAMWETRIVQDKRGNVLEILEEDDGES